MSLEAGVLIAMDGSPLYWHTPVDRSGGYLPDSRDLWDVIWERRDLIFGFAHSHPGSGLPSPSMTDLETFAAIESGLGRRLTWWITSQNALISLNWIGPQKLNYWPTVETFTYDWVKELREKSLYQTGE